MFAEKVLVVDDDESLLNMISFALQHYCFQVESAVDGYKALEKFHTQGPFAVLITDLMMPGMSGQDLLRITRNEDPLLEVIVITAAGSMESAIKAMREDGAYDFLLKPLESVKQLSLVVIRAAAHRRLIMEREALQAKIHTEAERLKALVANTGDAILAADADGILAIANPAAIRLIGREDMVGQPALSCLPLSLAKIVADWQAVGGSQPAVIEAHWLDGTTQMVNLTPLQEAGNNTAGWIIVMRDITHLKDIDEYKSRKLHEAVQKIQLSLVHAVNAVAELNQAAGQDEQLGTIVYRLSSLWGTIKDWGDQLSSLVEQKETTDINPTDINLVPMLVQIQQRLNDVMKTNGVQLHFGTLPNLPIARADPNLLMLLLEGLIKRAAMRSPQNSAINVNLRLHQDKVWVDITDQGPAVAQADLPHVFEKSLIDLNDELASTGLQLALAKKITDRMGGQIWIGGQGPIGSNISICLPAVSEHHAVPG